MYGYNIAVAKRNKFNESGTTISIFPNIEKLFKFINLW